MKTRTGIIFSLLFTLVACSADNSSAPATASPTIVEATATTIAQAQPSAIPTVDSTEVAVQTLVLWWPDTLSTGESDPSSNVLSEQIAAFDQSEDGLVNIEFRLKRYGDVGGIMSTMRTASGVAPGALPDLTLIRRDDLLSAVESGLVYPLDGLVPAGVIGDLYDPALSLGQIDGQLYGLPYMLDVQHIVYRPVETESNDTTPTVIDNWDFGSVLSRTDVMTFPARRANGLNTLVYAQYLEAGGVLPGSDLSGADAASRLSRTALDDVFAFYEQAYDAELISPNVLDFTAPQDYAADLAAGDIELAVVTSSIYLSELQNGRELLLAPLPSTTGQPIGVLDGWMWVLTTNNADRQAIVSRFIGWMMDIDRQIAIAESIPMLPSQRASLSQLDVDGLDREQMDRIVANALPRVASTINGSAARAIQTAFISVISGESTAEDAVDSVFSQLADG